MGSGHRRRVTACREAHTCSIRLDRIVQEKYVPVKRRVGCAKRGDLLNAGRFLVNEIPAFEGMTGGVAIYGSGNRRANRWGLPHPPAFLATDRMDSTDYTMDCPSHPSNPRLNSSWCLSWIECCRAGLPPRFMLRSRLLEIPACAGMTAGSAMTVGRAASSKTGLRVEEIATSLRFSQ